MVYPITILNSWLLASIIENVEARHFFVSAIVIKRFLDYRGPGDCSIKYTPLVRISTFLRHNKGLSAIVNDSTHKIAVYFTENAIEIFEAKYSQRLTFHTLNSLVILRKASLRFINNGKHQDFKSMVREIPCHLARHNSIVYLEVNEVEFFSRDQHAVPWSAENALRFVYVETDYQRRFMADDQQKSLNLMGDIKVENYFLDYTDDAYDGMISEAEEGDDIESQDYGIFLSV